MAAMRILSDDLVNKIAAGEVGATGGSPWPEQREAEFGQGTASAVPLKTHKNWGFSL